MAILSMGTIVLVGSDFCPIRSLVLLFGSMLSGDGRTELHKRLSKQKLLTFRRLAGSPYHNARSKKD